MTTPAPRRAPPAAPLILLLAASGPARALPPCGAPPAATATPTRSGAGHLAQARLFLRKGWVPDAAAELEMARATADGGADPAVWLLSAELELGRQNHKTALCFAEAAQRVAPPDSPLAADAAALRRRLADGYGELLVTGPEAGLRTRMQLEPLDPLASAAERQEVDRQALAWRERTALPAAATLPIGRYAVNGVDVEVVAERQSLAALPLEATGARGLAALQVTRVELGAGVWLTGGGQLPALTPTLQAGLTLPVGPLLVGVLGDALLPTRAAPAGVSSWVEVPAGGTVGLRLGADLVTALPLAIRPSLSLRAGSSPGITLSCTEDARCSPDGDGPIRVLTRGFGWMPGAELAVGHRRAGRSTALGLGARVGADLVRARAPAGGEAALDGARWAWTSDQAWITAPAFRLLGEASLAF